MVAANGFEPLTLRVWTACSSQLSYAAVTYFYKWITNLFYGSGDRTRTYDLRVMSPTSYQLLHPAIIYLFRNMTFVVATFTFWMKLLYNFCESGAEDQTWTGTFFRERRILSPVRLPIPPLRQISKVSMAPRVGLEPTAYRLTAGCSTIELPRNIIWRCLTFPGSLPPSIISAKELNFCVRDGNRCVLFAIITRYHSVSMKRIWNSLCEILFS